MKQVIQSYRTGELELAEVPAPGRRTGHLIVRNVSSVLSVGTERYMLELAKKSLFGKALARPDLVRQVVSKVRTEGLAEAYRQAMGRLDEPVPLGYSSAGVVIDVGDGVEEFVVGDRVACSGGGHASHAEVVSIPRNLAVKIPDGVGFEDAAFVTLGAISLHAVRMSESELGEKLLVLGLGLLGLLAVQILKAAGCRVLAADLAPDKVRLAEEIGADSTCVIGEGDIPSAARVFSGGPGVDAAIIFAATESNEPLELAARAARERGRLVVPGLVGLDIPRKLFYEKELSFVVSRAWGPGIYDPRYEQQGTDYPVSFVRWTARRNMRQFLEMIEEGKVGLARLISHRFPIERAVEAYESILEGKERFLGVLLTYPDRPDLSPTIPLRGVSTSIPAKPGLTSLEVVSPGSRPARAEVTPASIERSAPIRKSLDPRPTVRVGMIGAGVFARGTLLPALKGVRHCELRGVATWSGHSAYHVGRKSGFAFCTTDPSEVLNDPETDLVLIVTRHGSHARYASEALRSGKDVFVEKPLALDKAQLTKVVEAYRGSPGRLMVGFNRRFAPATREAIRLFQDMREPLMVTLRVNAGYAPADSWVHDPEEGGGRIVGEVCHFVDLAQALTRSLPVSVHAESIKAGGIGLIEEDNAVITLRMDDGSVAIIAYSAGGDKTFSRERVEIFGGGAVCVIENFKTLRWSRDGRVRRTGGLLAGVDRGHRAEMKILIESVRSGKPFPVPFEEYIATTRATFAAGESLRAGWTVPVAL